jgi:hypothetical protein
LFHNGRASAARWARAKNGIRIVASFGGHHGHQHYLGHPDKECRREAERFFRLAIRQTSYLGAKSYGTCFAIQTVRTSSDPRLRGGILEDALAAYRRLADYGAEMGLHALAYEMTSVPRETCATFAENDYVLEAGAHFAIPLRICLDLGHRPRNGTPEEADHLAWIRRYGGRCDVIDCQQTDREASLRKVIDADMPPAHTGLFACLRLLFEVKRKQETDPRYFYVPDLPSTAAPWKRDPARLAWSVGGSTLLQSPRGPNAQEKIDLR